MNLLPEVGRERESEKCEILLFAVSLHFMCILLFYVRFMHRETW